MATNTRTPSSAIDPTETDAPPTPIKSDPEIPFAGPPLTHGQTAQQVTLSHHLAIDGTDYLPGSRLLVSPDYAQRLRSNGYAARERR